MVKKSAAREKIWKRLKKLGEAELSLSFTQKSSREGQRLKKELARRTAQEIRIGNKAAGVYARKHRGHDSG